MSINKHKLNNIDCDNHNFKKQIMICISTKLVVAVTLQDRRWENV